MTAVQWSEQNKGYDIFNHKRERKGYVCCVFICVREKGVCVYVRVYVCVSESERGVCVCVFVRD